MKICSLCSLTWKIVRSARSREKSFVLLACVKKSFVLLARVKIRSFVCSREKSFVFCSLAWKNEFLSKFIWKNVYFVLVRRFKSFTVKELHRRRDYSKPRGLNRQTGSNLFAQIDVKTTACTMWSQSTDEASLQEVEASQIWKEPHRRQNSAPAPRGPDRPRPPIKRLKPLLMF